MKSIKIKKLIFYCLLILWATLTITCKDDPVNPGITVTITPEGGDLFFSDEMTLSVPPGAVNSNTDITLRTISKEELEPIFTKRGLSVNKLIYGVEGLPDGMIFNMPVQLVISTDLEPGGIPFIHDVDLETGNYTPSETEILYEPGLDKLTFTVDHFSEFAAEYQQELEDIFETCPEDECRCGRIRVEQQDKDYICVNAEDECQIAEIDMTVRFLDCPGEPVEEAFIREVNGNCQPSLTLSAATTTVYTGESTNIRAEVGLGCEPTEGQSVDFSISGPASVNPTYTITNSGGIANTTFTAGNEEGVATVTARSTVSYYKYTIHASAGGVEETTNGPLITEELNEQVDIEITEPEEYWSGTLTWEEDREYTFGEDYIEHVRYVVTFNLYYTFENSLSVFFEGISITSQEVTFTITDPICNYNTVPYSTLTIDDLNAPSSLQLTAIGQYIFTDPGMYLLFTIDFDMDDYPDPFYSYIPCCSDWDCLSREYGINGITIAEEDGIPLVEGTYSREYYRPGDGNVNPHKTISFTLNLQLDP